MNIVVTSGGFDPIHPGHIHYLHCKAIGRTANWIKGAPRWKQEKS